MLTNTPTSHLFKCRLHNYRRSQFCKRDLQIHDLRVTTQPLGVAEYQTSKKIEELKSELPSIDDLENTLEK